jgi:hypothetical protein
MRVVAAATATISDKQRRACFLSELTKCLHGRGACDVVQTKQQTGGSESGKQQSAHCRFSYTRTGARLAREKARVMALANGLRISINAPAIARSPFGAFRAPIAERRPPISVPFRFVEVSPVHRANELPGSGHWAG